jgi:hypothetical protein
VTKIASPLVLVLEPKLVPNLQSLAWVQTCPNDLRVGSSSGSSHCGIWMQINRSFTRSGQAQNRCLLGADRSWVAAPVFTGLTFFRRNHDWATSGETEPGGRSAYTSFAPLSSPATSLIPTPGPLGTVIFPFLTVIGGSNQLPNFSVPSLYS